MSEHRLVISRKISVVATEEQAARRMLDMIDDELDGYSPKQVIESSLDLVHLGLDNLEESSDEEIEVAFDGMLGEDIRSLAQNLGRLVRIAGTQANLLVLNDLVKE